MLADESPSAIDCVLESFSPLWHSSCDLSGSYSSLALPFIPTDVLRSLLGASLSRLREFRAIFKVPAPIIVVGDLHGNIVDLLRIFQTYSPNDSRYLFLGDYVDRGADSVSVLCVLLALFCKFPDRFFLLRGNHEFRQVNQRHGFYREVVQKYDEEIWETFQVVFSWLPLAAIVSDKVFCVHGGLSPSLARADSLAALELPIGDSGVSSMVMDLVWSDPCDSAVDFRPNKRGSGKAFGHLAVESFLKENDLKMIVRGHECCPRGYKLLPRGMVATVFSSSNYVRGAANECGVMHIHERAVSFASIVVRGTVEVEPTTAMSLKVDGIGLARLGDRRGTQSQLRGPPPEQFAQPMPMKRCMSDHALADKAEE
jgi:diadenosine tetraphosphatase ApaH/serine/threonine PP2A family protein phosphatase